LDAQLGVAFVHFEVMLHIAKRIDGLAQETRLRKYIQAVFAQILRRQWSRRQPRQAVTERRRTLIAIRGFVTHAETAPARWSGGCSAVDDSGVCSCFCHVTSPFATAQSHSSFLIARIA